MADEITNPDLLPTIARLSRDLRSAATTLSDMEARFLVDEYYARQEDRIRSGNQTKALGKSGEPHALVNWLAEQNLLLEKQIQGALDKYSASHPIGAWMREITGIGPVIAAGILAHIDITKAPTAGHIWSYSGLVPGVKWEKGKKRPWNATLKVLFWKLGESFVKVSNLESDYYGKVYIKRKELEWSRNYSGALADQADAALAARKIGKDTDAYKWYSGCYTREAAEKIMGEENAVKRVKLAKDLCGEPGSGLKMLPPAHIHARAKRFAVKLAISHLHEVWYKWHFRKDPPKPYATSILEHAHYIPPPHHVKGFRPYTEEEMRQHQAE